MPTPAPLPRRDPDEPSGTGMAIAGIGAAVLVIACCAGPALLTAGVLGAWLANPWVIAAAVILVAACVTTVVGRRRSRRDACCPPTAPWLGAATGIVLALLGAAMLTGRHLRLRLPAVPGRAVGGRPTAARLALFGAGYAVASLSCAFGVLPAVIAQAQATASLTGLLAVFAAYATGSATVLLLISIATAAAGAALTRRITALARHGTRITGAVLALTCAYLAWYWYPAATGHCGATTSGSGLARWSATASTWLQADQGAVLAIAATAVLAVAAALRHLHHRTHTTAATRPEPDCCATTPPVRSAEQTGPGPGPDHHSRKTYTPGGVMSEHFDAIVIGMGPGGEAAASRLLDGGLRVAVIERELIGGECAYWACIPSKTLLRPVEARAEAARAAGLSTPALDWARLRDYRDYMIRHLDDTAQIDGYRAQGATVIKGTARLAGPGQVDIDGQRLTAEHIILATGSAPNRPPIDGLDQVPVWTNRQATTLTDIPERAVLVGGSAVGVELGQFLARMGTKVTIIQRGPRLLDREDARLGELIAQHLAADDIDARVGAQARAVRRDGNAAGGETVVELHDGTSVRTDVIILAAGRTPRTHDLGLDTVGITPGQRGELAVDEHCRAGEGLWALGDVTGISMFTHVATYQGRIVADNILGHPRTADYTAIPRVVFAQPEIAAVGLTTTRARQNGIDVATTQLDLPDTIARPWTYETEPTGTFTLIADRHRRTLIGAWAIAPQAGEWIHTAALAIRHRLTLDALADGIAQFPTYNEAITKAAEQLTRDL